MDRADNIQNLLALRKLTRAISDVLRSQMVEHLATLTPLLRAKVVLGDYVQGGAKEPARRADKAFKELQALYETVATGKPFSLPRELKPPIDVPSGSLEVTPLEYPHILQANGGSRTITVRCPLTWVLTYSGFAPARLRELVAGKGRSADELQQFVLNYLAIHVVTTNSPGLVQILQSLHFPVTSGRVAEFGELPVTRISASISTSRVSDDLILESAELSGMDAFEEVVNLKDIVDMRHPHRDRLLEILRTQTPELAPAS